jgi:hypothetical protein
LGKLPDDPFTVLETVGDQVDSEIAAIDRHRQVVSIQDPAAPRWDQPHVDAVAVGKHPVAFVLGDRDIGHASAERAGQTPLHRSHHKGPPREGITLAVLSDE